MHKGWMCQAFSAPLKMKQFMEFNTQGKATGLPTGARSPPAGRVGYELKLSKHFVCRCQSVPFRRMVLEEVSLWEGRQASPEDQQAGTSLLWTPKMRCPAQHSTAGASTVWGRASYMKSHHTIKIVEIHKTPWRIMTDIVKRDLAYRPWEMAQSSLQEVLGRAQAGWVLP